jgi:hypothetical protein
MPDHPWRRRAAAWAVNEQSLASILLLGLLAAFAATARAQPIPRFPQRPAPLTYQRPLTNASAISVLYNGWPAVPVTPSIFVFSLNDLLPLNKPNKCTAQVSRSPSWRDQKRAVCTAGRLADVRATHAGGQRRQAGYAQYTGRPERRLLVELPAGLAVPRARLPLLPAGAHSRTRWLAPRRS